MFFKLMGFWALLLFRFHVLSVLISVAPILPISAILKPNGTPFGYVYLLFLAYWAL